MLEARKELPGLEHVIVVDGEAGEGTVSLAERRGLEPAASIPARAPATVGPDDLVTLIYTSGTTGPPKGVQLSHHNVMSGARAVEEVIKFDPGVEGDLVAARRAHRRADGPPLHPGHLRRHDHVLPEPARDPLLPAPGPAHLVLRGPADLGEAQGRARDDAGGPARGAAPSGPGGGRGGDRARAAPAARRAGARRARGEGRRRPTSRCSRSCARCSGSTRRSPSTSAPRRRRSRCSSSSTRSGSSWPSCGACPRRAARNVQPPRGGQDRHGRAA